MVGLKSKPLKLQQFRASMHKMSLYRLVCALSELEHPKKLLRLLEDTKRLTQYENALRRLRQQMTGRSNA